MRAKPITVPGLKPQNRVVVALTILARIGSGRHTSKKRTNAKDHRDMADRVRECGEW